MKPNLEKLRALLPELEAWKGGERRDIDQKICEALNYHDIKFDRFFKKHTGRKVEWPYHPALVGLLPAYLGDNPNIITEDAQRLVKKYGFKWNKYEGYDEQFTVFGNLVSGRGDHLILALVLALIANGGDNGKTS